MSEDVAVPRDRMGHPGSPPTPASLQTEEGVCLAVHEP